MNLRKATLNDLPVMLEIVCQAQHSLKHLGVDQWQNGYPNPEVLSKDIQNGCAYVLMDDDKVIAMVSVIYNDEPTYDRIYEGEWLSKGNFVVAHRMAVAKDSKKRGIASFLLNKVEQMAAGKGVFSFKVDTHENNLPMRHTLEKNGFTYCGRIFLADGNPRVAYEKLLK